MSQESVVSGGIPTAPYVNRVMELIHDPKPGDIISYEMILEAIAEPVPVNRLRTICGAYKRRLEGERELVLVSLRGQGYLVADAPNRIAYAARTVELGFKRIHRGAEIAARTDRRELGEEARRQCDYLTRVSAQIAGVARTQAKLLTLPEPALRGVERHG